MSAREERVQRKTAGGHVARRGAGPGAVAWALHGAGVLNVEIGTKNSAVAHGSSARPRSHELRPGRRAVADVAPTRPDQ